VRFTHSVLHAALKKAERDRRIVRNPATGAGLPRQTRTEMQVLTVEQKRQLLAVSERTGNKHHAFWHLLANSGMRPGEALALRWADVGADRVQVRAALVRGLPGGGWKLAEPKTAGSRRTVTLPVATMQAVAWHGVRQEAEKETARGRYTDHGFVFANETGGPLDLKNVTVRHLKPLLKTAELPMIEVYALRHTHATHLLSAGVPVKVVSERLGHASAMMTLNVYAHLMPGQQEDAVARMEAYEGA
jgi:integrase